MRNNLVAATARGISTWLDGKPYQVKEDNSVECLIKAVEEHSAAVEGRLATVDQTLAEVRARTSDVEQKMARRNSGAPTVPETLGSMVTKDEGAKAVSSNWKGNARISVKATITSLTTDALGSAGAGVTPDRPAGVIGLARRRLRVRDLFAQGQTTSNAVEWPRMKERVNNAATAAEGTLKAQSDLQLELVQWPVRTIAHWMLASKQVLDDMPALASIIDSELTYGVKFVEDAQLLNGAGSGSDLTGVYTTATAYAPPFTPTAGGNLTKLDVLLLAIAQVENADYEADGIVLNPLDWRDIQATKDDEGNYIGSGPFTAEDVARLWAMPVATSKAMAQGNFLVGGFQMGAQIFDRQEATVEISTEDSDNFRKNLVTLRGEERLAFVIKHADAFVKGDFETALSLG